MAKSKDGDLFYIFLDDRALAPSIPLTKTTIKSLRMADPDALSDEEVPILEGVGSSTTRDREGDTISDRALKSLCAPIDPLWSTCYVDHTYDTDHMLGKFAYQPQLTQGKNSDGVPTAMMKAGVRIFPEEPLAMKTLYALKRGLMIGYSVGFKPLEYDYSRDARGKPTGGITFDDVHRREMSSTPMPANPDSWITGIVKDMRRRGMVPSDDPVAELKHLATHWTDLDPLDGVRFIRVARACEQKGMRLISESFLDGRPYDALSDGERTILAQRVAAALSLASGA